MTWIIKDNLFNSEPIATNGDLPPGFGPGNIFINGVDVGAEIQRIKAVHKDLYDRFADFQIRLAEVKSLVAGLDQDIADALRVKP